MGMSVGKKGGGPTSDINVVPMIDILLVLLIIFMVIQDGLQRGVSLQVPPMESTTEQESLDQIVLEVLSNERFLLNQQPLSKAGLQARLTEVYAPRPRKVIFIQGAEDATYGDVIWAVDASRAAGIEVVGLVPRRDVAAAGA